jgi:hypothetical protein
MRPGIQAKFIGGNPAAMAGAAVAIQNYRAWLDGLPANLEAVRSPWPKAASHT